MNVSEYLQKQHVSFDVLPHPATYDAQHMAQMLHVPGREVAKSVLLRVDHGDSYAVAVVPADRHVNFEEVSRLLGEKPVELATEQEVSARCPDCEFGAILPFGSQYGMKTLVDECLTADEDIYFEGNTHHESIRMKFADFRRLESPMVASVATAT